MLMCFGKRLLDPLYGMQFSGDTCHFCMTPVIPGCSPCWRPKHQEPPLSGNYYCIHLFLLLSFNFFFFLGGEHWLSPAMLGGACPAPANCYCTEFGALQCTIGAVQCWKSVQCWRGRGSQVLQAWEPEQTALRKLFTTIIMTRLMMMTTTAN